MIPSTETPFHGIYVATLTPFRADGQIDEPVLAAHFRSFATVPGIAGVLCNGHAAENFLLTREERRRVTEIAYETLGASHIIVSGVVAEATEEAALHAKDAADAGADVVLVFPPFSWALSQDDRMAVTHHRRIGQVCGVPLMLYQAGVASAMAYRPEVLAELVQIPNVVGIKEGSWESNAYDRNRRLVKDVAPHVAMMASGDEHLLSCFVVGSEGSLVSLAVLMPAEIVALDQAVRDEDLATAGALHARIQPLANAIYGHAPGGLATARLKACMVLTGAWTNGSPRAPISDLPPAEIARLRQALVDAGLVEGTTAA
ncbi:dihydrodipicolinate synthase family protein [Acidisoma silvae]|uniref:Dihydrodipicolinate synthase family protein n=1 Tax=Acidisoma silvae TaxID=2802396 RepID=A0A963YWM0_9PROT|nr:dihydrodipicolinate synthase family protein [Acidisoma silvae]MCB8877493.1 dihydrodipicolinate synthase family protein [Acidisoma silvae]